MIGRPHTTFLTKIRFGGMGGGGVGSVPPRGHTAILGGICACHSLKESYLHLVGKGHWCCTTAHNAQDGPTTEIWRGPNVSAESEKRWSRKSAPWRPRSWSLSQFPFFLLSCLPTSHGGQHSPGQSSETAPPLQGPLLTSELPLLSGSCFTSHFQV